MSINLTKTLLCTIWLIGCTETTVFADRISKDVENVLSGNWRVSSDGNWGMENILISGNDDSYKAESKNVLEIIKYRQAESMAIEEMESALKSFEVNKVIFQKKVKNKSLDNNEEDEYWRLQENRVRKILEIYSQYQDNPDTCYLLGKYLYDNSKDKTKAISYFKKSLSLWNRRLKSIHNTFFHNILEAIVLNKDAADNDYFISVLTDFKPYIWGTIIEAYNMQTDSIVKERFLKIINKLWLVKKEEIKKEDSNKQNPKSHWEPNLRT